MKRLNKNILKFAFLLMFFSFIFFVPTNISHAGWLDITGDIISIVVAPIALLILKLSSLLNMLSGVLLNYVVQTTIVDMAKNYAAIPAIDSAWKVVRDLANMSFIFVLLYASIQLILGVGKDTRKLIVYTVIAALLMNFSLFFTKVIIDVSNLIALTFYHALAPGAASSTGLDAGLSNTLMEPLNLQSIWTGFPATGIKPTTLAIIGVMGSIMTLIATFIFFAISIMFIIRYVLLILVLILSPLAVVAHIIPSLSGYSKQWWSALINQSFFAPVYMILTWITVVVFGSMFKGGSATMVQVFTGVIKSNGTKDVASFSPGSMGVLFGFAVVICFLIATLIIAKNISNQAGLGVNKLTSWATGAAGGVAFGSIGWAGRKSLGRVGANVADNAELQRKAKEDTSWSGARARLALYAGRKARSGTFDARNMTIPTNAIGDTIEGTLGRTKFGKAIGADDVNWKSIPVGTIAAEQTGVGKGGTVGFKEGKDADGKRIRDAQKANDEELRKAQAKAKINAGAEAAKTDPRARTLAQNDAVKEMVKSIKDMTDKEIEAQKASTLKIAEVAEELSGKQLEKIQGSDNYTESEKKEIFDEHYKKINGALDAIASGTATKDQENLIKNLSDKEIELLPPSSFDPKNLGGRKEKAFLKTAGQSQIDGMLKGNKLVSTDKQAIKDARDFPLKNSFDTGNFSGTPDSAVEIMRKMKPEDLVKLDDSRLARTEILDLYSPPLLNKMAARSDFSEAKALSIRNSILAAGPGAAAGSNTKKSYDWLIGDGLNIF